MDTNKPSSENNKSSINSKDIEILLDYIKSLLNKYHEVNITSLRKDFNLLKECNKMIGIKPENEIKFNTIMKIIDSYHNGIIDMIDGVLPYLTGNIKEGSDIDGHRET